MMFLKYFRINLFHQILYVQMRFDFYLINYMNIFIVE